MSSVKNTQKTHLHTSWKCASVTVSFLRLFYLTRTPSCSATQLVEETPSWEAHDNELQLFPFTGEDSTQSWQRHSLKVWRIYSRLGNNDYAHVSGIKCNLEGLTKYYGSSWAMRLYFDVERTDPFMTDLCQLACNYSSLDLCDVR